MNWAFPYTAELQPFQAADDAWSAELRRAFGRNAGQARYERRGRGDDGTALRRTHDAREAARAAWHSSATAQPG